MAHSGSSSSAWDLRSLLSLSGPLIFRVIDNAVVATKPAVGSITLGTLGQCLTLGIGDWEAFPVLLSGERY